MYVTPTRSHDATWHIQRELVLNDCMVASARRYGSKQISKRFRDVPSVPPPDPDEQVKALRVVCRAFNSHDCTATLPEPLPCTHPRHAADALAAMEALAALGIVPPPGESRR